jgi:glycosyltransferase involved in cell wall biosynthesis
MSFRISIITATYNRRDLIGRCIESVAKQPYPDKEHIIVDGGSTDGTVEVIREYAARYPHIRWISEPDRGISDAFNKGLAMMQGDAVVIIGDDDFYEPDVFGRVVEEFRAYPEVGVVSGHLNMIRTDGSLADVAHAGFIDRKTLIKCWSHWCKDTLLPAPSTFIRREVIDTVGGFEVEDRYAMDYHHWIKITEKFDVRIIDQILANFRWDDGSTSFSNWPKQWAETLAVSKKHWGSKFSGDYYDILYSYWKEYRWPQISKNLNGRKKQLRRTVKQWAKNGLAVMGLRG